MDFVVRDIYFVGLVGIDGWSRDGVMVLLVCLFL